jgi:PIN domain nuclease of toxin-antitoxin system
MHHGFAQKSKSHLETVSTVRGSVWVAVPKWEIAIDYKYDRFTHPLPRTVLTVSKCEVLTFEAKPIWTIVLDSV